MVRGSGEKGVLSVGRCDRVVERGGHGHLVLGWTVVGDTSQRLSSWETVPRPLSVFRGGVHSVRPVRSTYCVGPVVLLCLGPSGLTVVRV